jgi:hypothetical protein
MSLERDMSRRAALNDTASKVQGHFAHTKQRPFRTLQ